MKRKNSTVKRKVNRKKKKLNEPKIKKFYKVFRKIIFKTIKNNTFLVAVSGGSDSLCLAYFAKKYKSEFKTKIHFIIINQKSKN